MVSEIAKTAIQMIGRGPAPGGHRGTGGPRRIGAGAVFVDVREPEEWQHGHIDGTVAHPGGCSSSSPTRSPRHKRPWTPARRVIVVCASGARRLAGRPDPQDNGLHDVAVLDGGLKAWTEAGLPTNEHEYSGV